MFSIKKGRALAAMLIALCTICVFALAACDLGSDGAGILESIPDLHASATSSVADVSEEESTPAGYTEKPTLESVINITPSEVVVAGKCETGSTVFVKGGKEDISVASVDGYYITKTTLINTTTTLLEITAQVEGKEVSLPLSTTAKYSAIAEPRLDGMNVLVGKDSRLYFEKMIADYTGENLLTQTKLREFKAFVNGKVSGLVTRAENAAVDLIYVLIPNSTAIDNSYLDASVEQTTHQTRYQQVAEAIAATEAKVVDMYDVFAAAMADSNNSYPIYRTTDSHLTEYGAYLAYNEVMKVIAERFPDAAPRSLDEFDIGTASTIGGDLAFYLGLDKAVLSETVPTLTPKFDISIGDNEGKGFTTSKINSVATYVSATDRSINVSKAEGTSLSRLYFRSGRENLPSALIYRDDSAAMMTQLLAERFNNAMFAVGGDFTINLTDAGRHKSEGKSIVDYVIVFVSESEIDNILD